MIVAAIVVAAAIGIGIALLQPRPELPSDDGGTGAADNGTEPAAGKEIVSVVSARSAFPFVQRWVSQYNDDESSLGIIEIGYYLNEPGAPGDVVIVGGLDNAANASRYVPVSAQAVAIVYNIPSFPDVSSGLKLNASLLSQILNGSITRWDDPAIRGPNRNLNLPAERIVVVHESSNSSLTLLEGYLAAGIRWPENSIGVMGPDELATVVRTTPYSIGYVDFSYATQTRMTFAAMFIRGEYVVPSTGSIDHAVRAGLRNVTDENGATFVAINASRLDNSSYPLTGLYYAAPEPGGNNVTQDFISWIIDEDSGQQALMEVQYPPIYRDGRLLAANEEKERASNSTAKE